MQENYQKEEQVIIEEKAQVQPIATPTKKYDHDEVLKASTAYFKGDTLAANVWMNKYALKDSQGNIYELTPDDMHKKTGV